MTSLRFHGTVVEGDRYRLSHDDTDGAIHIGDRDVIGEIDAAKFTGRVTIAIADEHFTADSLTVDCGWGYSEYTPMDPDELRVGDHDLIGILERREGETITMWVSDEPIDLGENLEAISESQPSAPVAVVVPLAAPWVDRCYPASFGMVHYSGSCRCSR